MAGENWTFWLQMTNLAMGAIILLAVVPVFGSVVWEVSKRARKKADESRNLEAELRALFAPGAHTLSDPELGLTMADGGEKIKTSKTDRRKEVRGRDHVVPIPKRRPRAILPRCSCPKADPGRAGSVWTRPLRLRRSIELRIGRERGSQQERCPHLEEIHVQYCGVTMP